MQTVLIEPDNQRRARAERDAYLASVAELDSRWKSDQVEKKREYTEAQIASRARADARRREEQKTLSYVNKIHRENCGMNSQKPKPKTDIEPTETEVMTFGVIMGDGKPQRGTVALQPREPKPCKDLQLDGRGYAVMRAPSLADLHSFLLDSEIRDMYADFMGFYI